MTPQEKGCRCHPPVPDAKVRLIERLGDAAGELMERADPLNCEPARRHRWHLPSLQRLSVRELRETLAAIRRVTEILEPTR
jgi:hypothetical protein